MAPNTKEYGQKEFDMEKERRGILIRIMVTIFFKNKDLKIPFYYAHSNMYLYYVRSKKIKLRKIKIWVHAAINLFIADTAAVLDSLLSFVNLINCRSKWNECEICSGDVCELLSCGRMCSRVSQKHLNR